MLIAGRAVIEDFLEKTRQLGFLQVHFHGLREIEKSFYGAVEPVDFVIEHLDGLLGLGIDGHVSFQNFQPEPHRIQRIFHLMSHACGNPSQRGEAFGNLQLVADAFERFHVMQRHERSHALAVLANHLRADADSPMRFAFSSSLPAFHRFDLIVLDAKNSAQRMARRKNLTDTPAAQFIGRHIQEFLDGWAYQHGAAFGVEKQQAVAKSAHHLIEILAHGAENLAHVVQLLSDPGNFRAHQLRVRRCVPPREPDQIRRRRCGPIAPRCARVARG